MTKKSRPSLIPQSEEIFQGLCFQLRQTTDNLDRACIKISQLSL